MRVVDLFCGCGGFSLGFEHAGFEVVWALDKWEVACESYRLNYPKTEVVCRDALEIGPSEIPDADVILGSPPCQEFSKANLKRPKKPDATLIEWFLKVVEVKTPKFWIMENVPGIANVLSPGIHAKVYRMCDFGIPQIRKRLFAGKYQDPPKIPTSIRFPAILATEYKTSIGHRQSGMHHVLRRKALIAECLLIQTFPLDYLLCGNLQDRYMQIGNAVPPLMAYRLAEAILHPTIKSLEMGAV